jgi:hypothetical protein
MAVITTRTFTGDDEMATSKTAQTGEDASTSTTAQTGEDAKTTNVDTGGGDVNINIGKATRTETGEEPKVNWDMWTDHETSFEAESST